MSTNVQYILHVAVLLLAQLHCMKTKILKICFFLYPYFHFALMKKLFCAVFIALSW